MKIALFFSKAYVKTGHKSPLLALVSRISTIGISLGIMVLVIGLSAMNGFEYELNNRVLAVIPQMQVKAFSGGLSLAENPNLMKDLTNEKEVVSATPFIEIDAILKQGKQLKVAKIKAVDKSMKAVNNLYKFVENNKFDSLNQATNNIILGKGIARDLGVSEGDSVELLLSGNDNSSNNIGDIRQVSLIVSGILRLDGQLDNTFALINLAYAQKLLGWHNQISGIDLKLAQPFLADDFYPKQALDNVKNTTVRTWIGDFGYMYRDIRLIRFILYISMCLVIMVACFNITSTLMVAIKNKQKDLAILKTIGATDISVAKIFLMYALRLSLKGCLIGLILGALISPNLTFIVKFLEDLFNFKLISGDIYFIDFLPIRLHFIDLGLIFVVTVIIGLLVGVYPAIKASKIKVARILSTF